LFFWRHKCELELPTQLSCRQLYARVESHRLQLCLHLRRDSAQELRRVGVVGVNWPYATSLLLGLLSCLLLQLAFTSRRQYSKLL